jgi:twinkle protein
MSYEYKIDDVIGFVSANGAETRRKGNELEFKYCPYCSGNKKDRYTFSINLETGAYCCLRASCGKQGHFVELARDFNYPLLDTQPKKYRKLKQAPIQIREPAIEYLKTRGISAEIAKKYKITTQRDKDDILVFPFFDENGIMVAAKYRKTDFQKGIDKNKEWFEHDTKPILFGMRQCVDFGSLVITEGQIDSLTLAECGIQNPVSVPTGARGFTWVEHCYNWVNQFKELIIFGDYENNRITLVDDIAKKFPKKKIKVVRKVDYLGEKDANDIYRKYGKAAILTAVGNAELRPVTAVKDLSTVKNINLSEMPNVKTGIYELDKTIGGIYYGQVALLTGKRGEGKSTLGSMIFKSALEQNISCFAYSGELPDYHFRSWLDLQVAGSQNIIMKKNEYDEPYYVIDSNIKRTLDDWYSGRAYVYDNDALIETTDEEKEQIMLLSTIERVARQYDVRFVLLDNLMTALDVSDSEELFNSQREFVKKIKRLAHELDIAILLIAHPKKENKSAELDNDSVSGTSDITNLVDIVMTYSKNDDTATNDVFPSLIGITKNRLTGKILKGKNRILVKYSAKTKRIACAKDDIEHISKCFKNDNMSDFVEILSYDEAVGGSLKNDLDEKFNAAIDKAARLYDK